MNKKRLRLIISRLVDSSIYRHMPLRIRLLLLSRLLRGYPHLFAVYGNKGEQESGYESNWGEVFSPDKEDR